MNNTNIKDSLELINKLDTGACYVVGGYIRNLLLGRESEDVDMVCDNVEAAKDFADRIGGSYFVLGEILHRVKKGRIKWDFTGLEKNIEDDLGCRDFTCDAMAVDLGSVLKPDLRDHIIDPFNGIKDIDDGIIRPVTENIFIDDPVRIVRAFRLKGELGFEFFKGLAEILEKSLPELEKEKGERIRDELENLFFLDDIRIVPEAAEAGIFEAVCPAVRTMKELKSIFKRLETSDVKTENRFVLMLAAIWKEEKIGERLKISRKEMKLLKEILSTEKDIFECWFRWGQEAEKFFNARYVITGDKKFKEILNQNRENIKLNPGCPLLGGSKIMEIAGLSPCPEVGKILKQVIRAQFEGKIKDEQEAIEYVQRKL